MFARDSLRVALALEGTFPVLGRMTLLRLATSQGIGYEPSREEEPGRIAHELRDTANDPVARELTATRGWGWPYYRAVDTTPLFVVLLVRLWRRMGRELLATPYRARDRRPLTLADAHRAALRWLFRRMVEPGGARRAEEIAPRRYPKPGVEGLADRIPPRPRRARRRPARRRIRRGSWATC